MVTCCMYKICRLIHQPARNNSGDARTLDMPASATPPYKGRREKVMFHQVIIWGHSLGAAVAVALASKVRNKKGLLLVLESPFTNMRDAGRYILKNIPNVPVPPQLIDIIPLGKLAKKADISFRSDLRLPSLQLPTLILHAEDDTTIPYQQGRNLYGTAVKAGKRDIRMVCFAYDLGCEHSFISKSRQLPALIRKFYNGQMRGPMLSRVTGKENMCMRTSRECTSPRKQWHGFDTACKLWWISSWHKPTKYQPMHYA